MDFDQGRSCVSQTSLPFTNTIITFLEGGKNVDVVYLDFAKAFDKVDFKITIHKLKNLGITGKLLTWLESFLTNRFQTVLVNGIKSLPVKVISGVPHRAQKIGVRAYANFLCSYEQNPTRVRHRTINIYNYLNSSRCLVTYTSVITFKINLNDFKIEFLLKYATKTIDINVFIY